MSKMVLPPQIVCRRPHEIEIPESFDRLYEIGYNLWWSWNPKARRLFEALHPQVWKDYRNPIEVLLDMDKVAWTQAAADAELCAIYEEVVESFDEYMAQAPSSWFGENYRDRVSGPIAYFSMEYGLHQCLRIYSGGLGVLSGDHLKSSSDLGLPFVGVGLLYRFGYFRQTIDANGQQQNTFPEYDYSRRPCRTVTDADGNDLLISVPIRGQEVFVKVWLVQVGRVPLLLLDSHVPENEPANRYLTNVLYVAGREMRLIQELLLGVGGVLTLRALGIDPSAWHVNEGHSALLQLERIRQAMDADDIDFDAAHAKILQNVAFTTHTPVPAGNETFDRTLALPYLEPWAKSLGVAVDRLFDIGSAERGDGDTQLNLTAFALKTSSYANGVSRLNAEVSEPTWRHLFPDLPQEQSAIQAITNGVHMPTWLGPEIIDLISRRFGDRWWEKPVSDDDWQRILKVPDDELWAAHMAQKERLGRFVRSRVLKQYARHAVSPDQLRRVSRQFDPSRLTIGFARRFATYKRAGLLFSDVQRLRSLLLHAERPVQIILAGKAHPADKPGKEIIHHIVELSREHDFLGSIFFLEDYSIRIGKMLVQGVDVWLNTPRKPHEASGTSGQKAAANGVLNCSILDGWWPEGFDGSNGWALGTENEDLTDESEQDRQDALSIYQTLESEVVPTFYERDSEDLPRDWLRRMKRSIAMAGENFSSGRMVRDYTEQAYLPLLDSDA